MLLPHARGPAHIGSHVEVEHMSVLRTELHASSAALLAAADCLVDITVHGGSGDGGKWWLSMAEAPT